MTRAWDDGRPITPRPSKEERIRRLATGALGKVRTFHGIDGLHIEYNEMEMALQSILAVLDEKEPR